MLVNFFRSVEIKDCLQTNKEIGFSEMAYARTQWTLFLNHEKGKFSFKQELIPHMIFFIHEDKIRASIDIQKPKEFNENIFMI